VSVRPATTFANLGAQAASADAYQGHGCGTWVDVTNCLYSDFSAGKNKATSEWIGDSTVTGRARLGDPGTPCSPGSQVGLGALGEGVQYSILTEVYSVGVDTTWSSSFIIGSGSTVYSTYCATF
jgi:hypothetical protein